MLGSYVLTESDRYQYWGSPCNTNSHTVVIIDGRPFSARAVGKEAWKAFEFVRNNWGYKLTGNDTGFYNCRKINHNPNNPWSAHAWATALDINWLENPAGNKLITDIPDGMISQLKGIRTVSGAKVFRWGGDFVSFKDAMHWELIANPLDLNTGIDWSTVTMDHTQARLIVTGLFVDILGTLPTGVGKETAQQRLTRIADEIVQGSRTVAQLRNTLQDIAVAETVAQNKAKLAGTSIPAWVLGRGIDAKEATETGRIPTSGRFDIVWE